VWRQALGATGHGAVQAVFKARSALGDFIYSVDIAILVNQLSNLNKTIDRAALAPLVVRLQEPGRFCSSLHAHSSI
jgi:hypothetical protein